MTIVPHNSAGRRAFSLVEAAISTVIVATMFAAGMAAAGSAARDRQVQREMRMGNELARMLMAEILQQRYADPAANSITPWPNLNSANRANWTHIDDYAGFKETPPHNRDGTKLRGLTGWTWQAAVTYQDLSSLYGAQTTTTPSGSGLISGLLGGLSTTVSAVLNADSVTDTGLKRITVTVKAPSGKTFELTGLRSSSGVVDRVSKSPGFRSWLGVQATIGDDALGVQTGAPLLNTPALP